MLTGQLKDLVGVPDSDWRKKSNPRFQGANFEKVYCLSSLTQAFF